MGVVGEGLGLDGRRGIGSSLGNLHTTAPQIRLSQSAGGSRGEQGWWAGAVALLTSRLSPLSLSLFSLIRDGDPQAGRQAAPCYPSQRFTTLRQTSHWFSLLAQMR